MQGSSLIPGHGGRSFGKTKALSTSRFMGRYTTGGCSGHLVAICLINPCLATHRSPRKYSKS